MRFVRESKGTTYAANDRGCQPGSQQLYLGRSRHGVHHRRGAAAQCAHRLYPDPQIPLCHQNHDWPHVPQAGCFRWCNDPLPGGVYRAGGHRGYRQHCRCGGGYCHRRAGRGVLDVVFRPAGHVHQIFGGHAGGTLPGAQCQWRAGGRPDVLHQKWPCQTLALAGRHLCSVRRADGVRHRQRHAGQHHYHRH